MNERKLELARGGADAWNDRDVDWLRRNGTDDFEFVPAVAGAVDRDSSKGPEGFARFLEEVDANWETFRIEPESFRIVGDVVLIDARVIAKGRGSGLELNQPIASVVHFRDDKIARMQSYLDPEEALAAAQATKEAA